jgi:hypothetical protein
MLNITGFIFLSAYSTKGYFYPNIGVGVVDMEDLFFCYHGLAASSTCLSLILYYPVLIY